MLTKLNTNITRDGAFVSCKSLRNEEEIEGAAINYNQLKKVLKEVFGNKKPYIIVAAANNSGIRADTKSPRKMNITDEIDKISEAFFGSKSNIDYFLNPDRYESDELAKLKPVISGCDAHSFSDLDTWLGNEVIDDKNQKSVTWIKANRTFEGLKQILYEPIERVKIQSSNPYLNFDKKFFSKINVNSDILVFTDDSIKIKHISIPLNPGLISIIGGRGEGKSILVDYIASIFKKGTKDNLKQNEEFKINFIKSYISKEKLEYTARTLEENLDFLYVPQNELKEVTNPKSPEKIKNHIYKLIGLTDFEFNDDLNSKINLNDQSLKDLKRWYFEKDENHNYMHSKAKTINSFEEVDELLQNISTKENKEKLELFNKNLQLIQKSTKELTLINQFRDYLKAIEGKYNKINSELKRPIRNIDLVNYRKDLDKRERYFQAIINKSRKNNIKVRQRVASFYKGDIEGILQDSEIYQLKKSELEAELHTFAKNAKAYIISKSNLIELIDIVKLDYQNKGKIIDEKWQLFFDRKFESREKNVIFEKLIRKADISVKGKIIFDSVAFYSGLRGMINGTKWRSKNNPGEIENYFEIDDFESFMYFVKTNLFVEVKKRTEYYYEEILDYFLLEDYRNVYLKVLPIIYFKNKTIDKLSGGEKGTLYLRMKLATSLFNNPIVIDQPEDELDNMFISNELVILLKEIKRYRQVILVTHNANIVVNSDAEQVIIAKNTNSDLTYKFGALEDPKINTEICEILEGGREAFRRRQQKYDFE